MTTVNTTRPRRLLNTQHPHMATRCVGVLFLPFFLVAAGETCTSELQARLGLQTVLFWPNSSRICHSASDPIADVHDHGSFAP